MREFLRQHWLLAGLLLFVVTFVINFLFRLREASRRMPKEKELECSLLRAAMALRKLARARRVLSRFMLARDAARGLPIPQMVGRLWKAANCAADAASHLSAVLKKATHLGYSIQIVGNLDRSLSLAERTREECRRQVKVRTVAATMDASTVTEHMASLLHNCRRELERAREIVDRWAEETRAAELELVKTVDPVIYRSGGLLRNPFRKETIVEMSQSESVLSLRLTIQDVARTARCLDLLERTIETLCSPAGVSWADQPAIVGRALDSIDEALGDAELPLPAALATGETPLDPPGDRQPTGSLQKIYADLSRIEALLIAARSGAQR